MWLHISHYSNFPPIFHCFRDTALQSSKIATFSTPLWLNPPTEGFPWDDLRKIFTEGSQMARVPNGVDTLPKISIAWVCTNITDDRQTDGRTTTNVNSRSRSLKTTLSCTVSKLWLIIGQIWLATGGHFTLMLSLWVIPCEYPDKLYLSRNYNDCPTWH